MGVSLKLGFKRVAAGGLLCFREQGGRSCIFLKTGRTVTDVLTLGCGQVEKYFACVGVCLRLFKPDSEFGILLFVGAALVYLMYDGLGDLTSVSHMFFCYNQFNAGSQCKVEGRCSFVAGNLTRILNGGSI